MTDMQLVPRTISAQPVQVTLNYDIWCLIFKEVTSMSVLRANRANVCVKLFEAFEYGEYEEEYMDEMAQAERDGYKGPHRFYLWLGSSRLVNHEFNRIIQPLVYQFIQICSQLPMERLLAWPESHQIKVCLTFCSTRTLLPTNP